MSKNRKRKPAKLYICQPCGSEHNEKEYKKEKRHCRFCSTIEKLIKVY